MSKKYDEIENLWNLCFNKEDIKELWNLQTHSCSIIIDKRKNINMENLLLYVSSLIKFAGVRLFYFNSYGKIEKEILKLINSARSFCDNFCTIIAKDVNKKDKNYFKFFDDIYECEHLDNFSLIPCSRHFIIITDSFETEIYEHCSKCLNFVKLF